LCALLPPTTIPSGGLPVFLIFRSHVAAAFFSPFFFGCVCYFLAGILLKISGADR
jgi:hypothetical protein